MDEISNFFKSIFDKKESPANSPVKGSYLATKSSKDAFPMPFQTPVTENIFTDAKELPHCGDIIRVLLAIDGDRFDQALALQPTALSIPTDRSLSSCI